MPEPMQSDAAVDADATVRGQRELTGLVVKNTFYLTASQALTIPLAIVVNAAMARYLGAADFGAIYLCSTLCGFGFLAVNWGHDGALPALVAQDRTRSGVLLASSLVWRVVLAVVVYILLAIACALLGYDVGFQWVLALTCGTALLNGLAGAGKDTIRSFERTDIPAYLHVGQQLLAALVVVPVLVLGGRVRAALIAQALPCFIVIFFVWRALRPVGVGRLSFQRQALIALFKGGSPFVLFGLAMALQPNVDAIYLSKLAPSQVMGWFAVSRRLIGVLIFPASALIGALYPTLCRLHVEDRQEFVRVSRGAFYGVAMLVIPVALGCALYPDIGIAIFSRKSFGPAENNLRVLSMFLLLVYFTMPLGTCILAAGKQRQWSLVQSLCVLVSLALDPLLVPWFQRHDGNGGLGICVASVVSEVVVVACGVWLAPRGVFDRRFAKSIFLAGLSGAAMALAARLLKPFLPALVAAPIAVASYLATLWLTGGIDKELVAAARSFIRRKFSRA
jgi:O-antigen/teichoic acid export membrane protein